MKEIKNLFQKKLKDRQKIKGISFSYEEKKYITKNRNKDISFKQKKTDKEIINSFKKYNSLKSLIYFKEQKEKTNVKKEKMEKESIKELKHDLNYTNLLKLFNLKINNPFNYNIKKKKQEIEHSNRSKYKNKVKYALLAKKLKDKKIKSRIDSGIKKDLDFYKIYKNIENSKIKLGKKKSNGKKLVLDSNITRDINDSNINLFKDFNKSNENKLHFKKYFENLNNSQTINEKNKFEPSSINLFRKSANINSNMINIKKLYKSNSEIKMNISSPKNKKDYMITNLSKRYIINDNKTIKQYEKNNFSKKNFNKSFNNNVLKESKNINNFGSNIKFIKQKKNMRKELKKFTENIEEMFKEYTAIKEKSNKLKIDYKIWHFSKFSNIEEIINTKEDMLLSLLKQKYFNSKSHDYLKSKKIKKEGKKPVIQIIRDNFNRIEDEELKFRKKVYLYL